MRSACLLGFASVLVCILFGCGSEPVAIEEAKKIDQPTIKAMELIAPVKPMQSQPEAAKLLQECLEAHSSGKPELLKALQSCSIIRSGAIEKPAGRLRMTWKTKQSWPDRYRVTMEIQTDAISTLTYCMAPGNNWQYPSPNNPQEKAPLNNEVVSTMKAQFEEDSITMIFGLAELGVLCTRGTDETISGVELLTLHIWTPHLEYAQIGIDKTTKLLRRVVYNGKELNETVIKEVLISGYTEFDQLKLPSRMVIRGSGRILAEWFEVKLDSSAKVELSDFEKP
jgi:hypothetical protein